MPRRDSCLRACLGLLVVALALPGCDDDAEVVVPLRPAYNEWLKIELPGTVCGNGSQYKFFVNYSDSSNDLVVAFEPGGACWDYPSCTGANGIRGAANVDGLEDTHWEMAPFIIPFFQRAYDDTFTNDWNMVYIPYCTGDVHTGNRVVTYSDPEGEGQDVVFHHNGHANTMAVIDWMAQQFTDVPRMLVTGCSAGGVGSTVNYHFLRKGLPGVRRGYLLADSGPLMPAGGYSDLLHDQVYEAWDLPSIFDDLPASFDPADFGSVNTVLADEFPDDRLAITYFQRDYNFTLYSYERFYDYPPKDEIMRMWAADTARLEEVLDSRENFAYYFPYWRALNDSHCTTLITFAGSEIEEQDVDLYDFVDMLLDDGEALKSYVESPQPGEDDD